MKEKTEFSKLWSYAVELRESNPRNSVYVVTQTDELTGKPQFLRMYVCLAACKDGFLAGCRRFIGVDGCFLKEMLKGELLTVIPRAHQRMCGRHIYANWRKKHGGKDLKRRFWASSKATYFESFKRWMYDMALTMSASAYEDLVSIDPRHWARAMFPTEVKCENVDNNMCESFNATLIAARNKCIIGLMEHLRLYVAKRMREKRMFGESWRFEYGPRIRKRITKSQSLAYEWNVDFKSDVGYEIKGEEGKKHVVKLNAMSCTCRRWDLTGIPCAHAVCAIQYEGFEAGQFLAPCYSRNAYVTSYSYQCEPIRGEEFWPLVNKPEIQPPEIRNLPGRKKKKRRLEEHERAGGSSQSKGKKNKPEMKTKEKATRQMSCGWCKGLHHNKRGCPDRAYYLALEARLKEGLARANPNANVDAEVAPAGGGAANVAPDNAADDGPQVDANLNQTEQDVEDCLDDMPVSQAPTQDMPPSQQPSIEPAVTNAQPTARKKLTPVRGQRPFTLPRTIGMGLYQNVSTGLTVLNSGQLSQRVLSSPTWSTRGQRNTAKRGKGKGKLTPKDY